jgi:hypothetical protein
MAPETNKLIVFLQSLSYLPNESDFDACFSPSSLVLHLSYLVELTELSLKSDRQRLSKYLPIYEGVKEFSSPYDPQRSYALEEGALG